jgi:ankyrin repeat protein
VSKLAVICCGCILLVFAGCRFFRSDNLNQAVVRGDYESVRNAIARGMDVNGRGMHAMTPLMKAAEVGRLDICKLLVQHGADANAHNESGSVLMWAVSSGNEELVHFIVKSGASKSWTNDMGQTAETMARQRGFTNIASIVKID